MILLFEAAEGLVHLGEDRHELVTLCGVRGIVLALLAPAFTLRDITRAQKYNKKETYPCHIHVIYGRDITPLITF